MIGVGEMHVRFKVWFNFIFMKKHVKNIWLKTVIEFDVGNKITYKNINHINRNLNFQLRPI